MGRVVPVSTGHPNVTAMFAAGQGTPAGHPGVHVLLQPWLPATHPGDIDGMLRDPEANPLPYWHPKLEDLLARKYKNGHTKPQSVLSLIRLTRPHVPSAHVGMRRTCR